MIGAGDVEAALEARGEVNTIVDVSAGTWVGVLDALVRNRPPPLHHTHSHTKQIEQELGTEIKPIPPSIEEKLYCM